jgi:SAM-dependent methyltransferase
VTDPHWIIEQLNSSGVIASEVAGKRRVLEVANAVTAAGTAVADHASVDLVVCVDDPRWDLDVPSEHFSYIVISDLGSIADRPREGHGFERGTSYTGSGLTNVLREVVRALAPGGVFLVLTENAVSLRAVHQVLNGQHPVANQSAHRTFTAEQLRVLVGAFGLAPVTVTSSTETVPTVDEQLGKFLSEVSRPNVERGDVLLGIFQKPLDGSE